MSFEPLTPGRLARRVLIPHDLHLPWTIPVAALAAIALLAGQCRAQPHLPAGTEALPSAAEGGRGPLALLNLHHHLLGHARVFDGRMPDLFLAGAGGPQAVWLCKWVALADDGAPVFAPPVQVSSPFKEKGRVFQREDGTITGLWLSKGCLVTTVFDRDTMAFRETARVKLPDTVQAAASFGVLVNEDGANDFAFELSNGAKGTPGNPWTEEWRPFNSSGIATGELRYRYLAGWSPGGDAKQITTTRREVYFSMHDLTGIDLGPGHERDIITGSRQGNLVHYRNLAARGFELETRRLAAGPDGIALRHPSINPSVCAYPGGLIAAGEGALYFYRFTGGWTPGGAPVFSEPLPVLQERADLYAGTLPSPTAIDWDGDGIIDIITGNSEGFVLFFKNIGDNEEPRFLPGARVQAGGRDIHVQAGYSGSLQGLQENRWGYLSPNAFDWNDDGLPDLVTGDISGDYLVYLNRGTRAEPRLDPAQTLYCDGIPLRGMWRCRPALARVEGRAALVIVDGGDHFHLYWRIDDHNVEDGGKLLLEDGKPIGASGGPGGWSGRAKLDLFDWNGDGRLDLIIGTNRVNSIPDRKTGLPMPGIGIKTLGTPLLMLNTGAGGEMRFARPVPFRDEAGAIIQPGGAHETGAVGTMLGKNGPNLLICHEAGRLFLLPGKKLKTTGP
jgi:hypothetical protein